MIYYLIWGQILKALYIFTVMSLDIAQERCSIFQDLTAIEAIALQMPQRLIRIRELSQLSVLLKLVAKHLTELEYLENHQNCLFQNGKLSSYWQANTRIKNHILRKGGQIRHLIKWQEIKPFAITGLKALSSILLSLEGIEKKIQQLAEAETENPDTQKQQSCL